jgi:hypothetical protein
LQLTPKIAHIYCIFPMQTVNKVLHSITDARLVDG